MEEREYCGRCNRKLRTKESRERGLGPVCYRKEQIEDKHPTLEFEEGDSFES